MTEPLFNVIAEGRPAAGFEPAVVARQLVAQLRLSEAQAGRLLDGRPVIAKRNVAHDIASAYCARLGTVGLQVRIEPASNPPQPVTPVAAGTVESLSAAPEWPDLAELFGGLEMPSPHARNARHAAAMTGIGLQASTIAALYVGLAAIAAAALVGYTASFHYLLTAPPLLFSIPVFLAPWLALLALVALLLRPLLPLPHGRPDSGPVLHAQLQPRLFHWLAQLCELVALPMPRSIELGTQVAHAVRLHDERGALRRAEYSVVLSLPLLDTTDLRTGTALGAATLAARAGATSLRCQWLLQVLRDRVQACLERRDRFGALLASGGRAGTALLALHEPLLRPLAARLEQLHGRLERRITQETDRLFAAFAGSAHFADSLLSQHQLEQAWRDAIALSDDNATGRAADLPALIHHYHDHFDHGAAVRLRKQWREVGKRSAATAPPTPGERIEATLAQNSAGTLPITTASAEPLLAQRETLARLVTTAFYRNRGLDFEPEYLQATEALLFAANDDLLRREQTAQYFNDWFRPFRFWRLADHALLATLPVGDAVQQLNVCVNEIRRLTPDRARLLNEYERLQNAILDLATGQQVLAQARPYTFRYAQHEGAAPQRQLEEQQQLLAKVTEQLATQETIMGGRIGLGLRLCGAAPRDVARLQQALALVAGLEPRLYRLALDAHVLEQLTQRRDQQRETCYALPIRRLEEKIDDAGKLLGERLREIPYPIGTRFDSVADYVVEYTATHGAGHDASPLARCRSTLGALYALNETLSACAANFGTTAEEAYGIEPIRLVAGA